MARSIATFAAISLLLLPIPASAQTPRELDQAKARQELGITTQSFPSPEQVIAMIDGRGMEATAKRAVALETFSGELPWMFGFGTSMSRDAVSLETRYRQARHKLEWNYFVDPNRDRNNFKSGYREIRARWYQDDEFRAGLLAQYGLSHEAFIAAEKRAKDRRLLIELIGYAAYALLCLIFIISFLRLLIGAARDRRRKDGVTVKDWGNSVDITSVPGKFGPVTAMSIYPLYFNIALFALTLAVPLAFFVAAIDVQDLRAWFGDAPVPFYLQFIFYKQFWIAFGLMVLFAPWWLLARANGRRRKPQSFSVSEQGFTVGGKTYAAEKVGGIYGCGPDDDAPAYDPGDLALDRSGNARQRAAESGRLHRIAIGASRSLFKRKLARVRQMVFIELDGERVILADRLPLERAKIVFEAALDAARRLQGDGEPYQRPATIAVD